MIVLDDTLISDDVIEKAFVCDLNKCKGACCEEGDYGAPLEQEEIAVIEKHLPEILPFMNEQGRIVLQEQGFWETDPDNDPVTTTWRGRDCLFAVRPEDGILKCAIEMAYRAGKIDYYKPISCHLYPIRVTKTKSGDALNYDKWSICSDACKLGEQLQVPVYRFLKEPLIRKYGEEWFEALDEAVQNPED